MIDWIVIGIALSGTLLGTSRAAVLGNAWLPAVHAAVSSLVAFALLPVVTRLPAEQIVAFTSSPFALNVVGSVLVVEALVLVLLAPGLIVAARDGPVTLRVVFLATLPSPGTVMGLVLSCSLIIRINQTLSFATVAALVSLGGLLVLAAISYGLQLLVHSRHGREGVLFLAALLQLIAGSFLPVLMANAMPTTAFLRPELIPTLAVLLTAALLIGLGSRLPLWSRRSTRA